jgi:PAS domain S-box-containing protein
MDKRAVLVSGEGFVNADIMAIVDIIDASHTAAVISNPRLPDNPIVACNDAFLRLTGYDRDEVIGRNCRFLRGAGTEPDHSELLRSAIRKRQPVMVEILNYRKDGSPFRNAVMIAPIFDDHGEVEYFLGSQMKVADDAEISEAERRRAAEVRIDALAPRQREILLLMAGGKLNKQIAYELAISERTVKMHRSALFKALGVQTSADAIRLAVESGH